MKRPASGALLFALLALVAHCGQVVPDDGLRHPPPRPNVSCPAALTVETFAIDSIDLGESDWQTLGYDLDDKATTKTSSDVCTLQTGSPLTNQVDGDQGIDDAFGKVIVPILQATSGDSQPSSTLTSAIDSGRFTLQIQVTDVDGTPTQTCDGLRAQVFPSDAFGSTPAFDATTRWPVMSESLQDPTDITAGSKAAFDDAYIQNGTFVAGATGGVDVLLHLVLEDGNALDLLVHEALLTFDVSGPHEATNGVLAGVIDTEELVRTVEYWAKPACCADWCDSADPLRQANDILLDRTNSSGAPCDGISFAVGFHARQIANPIEVTAPLPQPPPPCP